jgi:hypothetical protein
MLEVRDWLIVRSLGKFGVMKEWRPKKNRRGFRRFSGCSWLLQALATPAPVISGSSKCQK